MSETKTTSITEFLIELDEKGSLAALQGAYNNKSVLFFKTDAAEIVVQATINSFVDKKVILNIDANTPVTVDKEVSIKFNIGTEIYFVKTPIKKHLNLPCFDLNSKVIQLKRRKEPRYIVPKKWVQTAAIISHNFNVKPIPCVVTDISTSGIRFETKEVAQFNYKRDDIIKIQFQIHRRAEVQCDAIVRFFMNRLNHGSLLGLELVFTSDLQRERTAGIVNDIIGFQAGQKF